MEITKEHIAKIHTLLDAGLSSGLGSPEPGKMCDDPGCVSPALRQLKIRLNDSASWSSNKARAEGMRRLAIAQLGSKDVLNEREFATRVARMTIQTVIPAALRSAARLLMGEHPTKLLVLATKCEQEPTQENARAAAYAANAAYAAAHAARTAANADAYAAALGAAYAAAHAARTAANAATYAATRDKILADFAENVVQILIDMQAPGTKWLV